MKKNRSATTRTGSMPIGVRCNTAWMSDISNLVEFVTGNGFECVDTPAWTPEQIKAVTGAGISIGTVDLPQPWQDLTSPDSGKRMDAVDCCAEYAGSVAEHGARIFFVCVFTEDVTASRRSRMDQAIEGYGRLCEKLAALPGGGAKVVIEGWPGPDPHNPVLACTPEGYRTILHGTGAANLGINFDPSHLIRMGIDSVRFAEEFAPHVFHAHGKDTELLGDGLYEYGTLQPAVDPPKIAYGGTYWRYAIPGHGCARWGRLLKILAEAGYKGKISIELEDCNFNGSEEGEKRGFIAAKRFLEDV